jgi:hypothetical protein
VLPRRAREPVGKSSDACRPARTTLAAKDALDSVCSPDIVLPERAYCTMRNRTGGKGREREAEGKGKGMGMGPLGRINRVQHSYGVGAGGLSLLAITRITVGNLDRGKEAGTQKIL